MTTKNILTPILIIFCSYIGLNAQAPFTVNNSNGNVTYTSNLSSDYLHFYLFGDGYFSKEKEPYHEFNQSNTSYTTKLYYPKDKDVNRPKHFSKNVGTSSNGAWVPPPVSMKIDIDSELSWNFTKAHKNYIIIKFENNFGHVSDGCVEFTYDTRDLVVWPQRTLVYNDWIDGYNSTTGVITFNYTDMAVGEQRIIYLPARSKKNRGNVITYDLCIKDNCASAGAKCNTTRSAVSLYPHDPNELMVTNIERLSTSYKLYEVYEELEQNLVYYFQFYNDGAAPATNVVVDQFFDHTFDLGSVNILASSFDEAYWNNNGNGDVSFYFDNINLPGINEAYEPEFEECIGWLTFSICLLDNITPVECVESEIDIYFDNQPPVSTNSIICTGDDAEQFGNLCNDFIGKVEIENFNQNEIHEGVFPNPATDQLNIQFGKELSTSVEIFTPSGRLIHKENTDSTMNAQIDIGSLEAGIYIIKYKDGPVFKTHRFVKI